MSGKYVYTDDKCDSEAIELFSDGTYYHLKPDTPQSIRKQFKSFKKNLLEIEKEQDETGVFIF
jgi:hypothetical protein